MVLLAEVRSMAAPAAPAAEMAQAAPAEPTVQVEPVGLSEPVRRNLVSLLAEPGQLVRPAQAALGAARPLLAPVRLERSLSPLLLGPGLLTGEGRSAHPRPAHPTSRLH